MADTLLTLTTKILYLLGDAGETIWTATEIKRYVNEGYVLLLGAAKPLWKTAYSNDVADTATYTLPADLVQVDRVTWNWGRIPPLTVRELQQIDNLYRTNQGPVRAYCLEGDGTTTIRKWLVPALTATEDQDDNNTRIEYYARGAALSDGAPNFEIPDSMILIVRHYAMWKAYERRGQGQVAKLAELYKTRFDEGVVRIKRRVSRPQLVHVGHVGSSKSRPSSIAAPRLPWQFGRTVRYYR